ncbi:galactokinase [Candidatus Viridilinea mediisalina]|uniref:Galactokinase n=1 Tax=Candidatus Viridilinea mediisalina TaxID=2024553 RepID=A0A2A6RNG7_9CHLR|nr:galactokinase [Candidatus Viridilinea mediisalina]PDW04587.1 galactokinase [Candidatus Viridilinea mediisalina]
MPELANIHAAFYNRFGKHPRLVVQAPGRVNLIGEHTDYNEGFVLPVALDRATFVAARARTDRIVQTYSVDLEAEDRFALDWIERSSDQPWSNYIRGVAKSFMARDLPLLGADLLIMSDLPMGAGLASSAALAVAVAYALQSLNNVNLLGEELALLAQGAEQSFVGVQCGIMDQFVAALGHANHALLLDCRDLSYHPIPIPPDVRIVVCDSGVRHQLVDSDYNERRSACQAALRLLRGPLPQIAALRDVSMAQLEQHAPLLPRTILQRARHVISELERTQAAAAALEHADLAGFGALMNASHASLRDDYAVSVPELDALVAHAQSLDGCYGSRLTGGGFGGSTVSLVRLGAVERFTEELIARYHTQFQRTAHVLVCVPAEGVGRIAIY